MVVSTSGLCSHSWFIIELVTRVTRRVSHMEQKLLTRLEHMSSPQVLGGVNVARSLVFCVVFCKSLFAFLSFFDTVLSVLLRFTASDYPFSIFKFVLHIHSRYSNLSFMSWKCQNVMCQNNTCFTIRTKGITHICSLYSKIAFIINVRQTYVIIILLILLFI